MLAEGVDLGAFWNSDYYCHINCAHDWAKHLLKSKS